MTLKNIVIACLIAMLMLVAVAPLFSQDAATADTAGLAGYHTSHVLLEEALTLTPTPTSGAGTNSNPSGGDGGGG